MTDFDLRKLRPGQITQLLNSTRVGEALKSRQIDRHRQKAGFRIGDGKTVDIFKYLAWQYERYEERGKTKEAFTYEDQKERARKRAAELSKTGRDIGKLPPVRNPGRKADCERDFKRFCESYFPSTFNKPWSPDHLKVIAKMETTILEGGLFSVAMPRGTGKTSLCEAGGIFSVVYGHHPFAALIGSDEGGARQMLESIQVELETNDLLLEDFPEVCYPIRALEGIAIRCKGQLFEGKRTHISWKSDQIVLPTIPGSKGSGAIINVSGITGGIRGMKFKRPDGKTVRPTIVILDDPQTDESARSNTQSATREAIINGAILGLAGPGKKIAAIMPCTVIEEGDLADQLLDQEKNPHWRGERTQMLYRMPDNMRLWDQYAQILEESYRQTGTIEDATAFYEQNREAMDAGSKVAWAERYNSDEVSALQHAMNLLFRDEHSFHAEYQNAPLKDSDEEDMLTPDEVASKTNGLKAGEIPIGATNLTMFIDVQGKLLYYLVAAWGDSFNGWIVDYGTWPDQNRDYFTLRDARITMADKLKGAGLEGQIYNALEKLTGDLLTREWSKDDGSVMRIDRCLIDANWGEQTEVVYQFCRQSAHANIIYPSHGRFVGASRMPMAEYKKKRGDKIGLNWRIPNVTGKRQVRHVVYDTNFWKSFIEKRFKTPMGDRGCLSIYGRNPRPHKMLAEQLTAEFRVKTEGRGRVVYEWKPRPNQPDNHWFDCIVGSAVAASIQGVTMEGLQLEKKGKERKKVKLSEVKRRRNG